MQFKIKLRKKNSGATIIEYVVILSLVGIVCFTALKKLGNTLMDKYNEIGTKIGTDYKTDRSGS